MEYPISLYYDTEVSDVKTLDLCRGDDDYRKVHIVDDGNRKLVIKYLSNTFSDKRRIEGWFKLMDEYRKIGLYCPAVVPNRNGELLHCDTRHTSVQRWKKSSVCRARKRCGYIRSG